MVKTTFGLRALPALALVLWLRGAPAPAQQPAEQAEDMPPALLALKPIAAAAGNTELQKLLRERYNAAVQEVQGDMELFRLGRISLDFLLGAQRRLLKAGLELKDRPADRIALLKDHVELAKAIESEAKKRFDAGTLAAAQLASARYARLDVQVRLLREQDKARTKKGH